MEAKDWKSVFDPTNSLYKECLCSCGNTVTVKMPFMGSGHDDWNKKVEDDLDKRIEEEDSKSRKK
jgi:hypothetical protein